MIIVCIRTPSLSAIFFAVKDPKIETIPIRDPTYKASKFNKPKFQKDIYRIEQLISVTKASVPIICPPTKPLAARAVNNTDPGPNITPLIVP